MDDEQFQWIAVRGADVIQESRVGRSFSAHVCGESGTIGTGTRYCAAVIAIYAVLESTPFTHLIL
jgi:hypothetical protein